MALCDKAQTLSMPDMYGKKLTFKTGGVDGCDCEKTLNLIAEGKLDTEPLTINTYYDVVCEAYVETGNGDLLCTLPTAVA